MNNVTEKERRAKIMLILMTNLKAKYNKIAMENGFVSIDDALIATLINDAMEADTSVASKLGEDYYKQRALVRNYFSTEHYQYYKGDYQFFRLGDIDRILEDAKPAVVEKEQPEVPGPVPGTPTPADPPGFDNHNNIVDDIPELPPLPEEGHHTVPTVPTNDDNTGDIPELPPLPPEGTNDATTGGDVPELPPLPPTDGSTETTPHENEPGSASPAEPPAPPSVDETVPELPKEPDAGTVVKPPVAGNDDIPPLPPTDDELPPLPGESTDTHTSEPTVKIPTTMPDGSPLPPNATVDPNTGIITVDSDEFITEYYPDGRTSVSAKDHL